MRPVLFSPNGRLMARISPIICHYPPLPNSSLVKISPHWEFTFSEIMPLLERGQMQG